jgi:hypothetical protein
LPNCAEGFWPDLKTIIEETVFLYPGCNRDRRTSQLTVTQPITSTYLHRMAKRHRKQHVQLREFVKDGIADSKEDKEIFDNILDHFHIFSRYLKIAISPCNQGRET